MHAEEARKVTLENANKAAERELSDAINNYNQEIKMATERGCYGVRITHIESRFWIDNHLIDRLKRHFQSKGYRVDRQLDSNEEIIFSIRWDD